MVLFGSVARGEATDESDIDILIVTAEPISYSVENDLYDQVDSCVSRLYYAAFYAMSALLALRKSSYGGHHSAVRASLHRDFVKPGLLSYEVGIQTWRNI